MAKRELLLGDEALALGALHAGLSGVYAYPGTPSTEITEYIQQHPLAAQRNVHRTWSSNEKTAMEEALGMSFAGKRALVCMKHVGLNVAADAFVNSAMTGANGGLVVVAADDPSMHSSQNEQDSRFYGKFALVPTFEPSTQQEAYEMVQAAAMRCRTEARFLASSWALWTAAAEDGAGFFMAFCSTPKAPGCEAGQGHGACRGRSRPVTVTFRKKM
jgi:TPP-dependent indolepyruvate ferredoxin oxidoreductase alpha subunit